VIAGQHPHLFDYSNVPGATYCHPEVVLCRPHRAVADRKLDYKVGRFNFAASGCAYLRRDGRFREDHPRRWHGEIPSVGAHATG
jgi:pyruvate/2-oxoglutarate dehydrogenase complex dihydrolipoamide dehydrogenase (E3) component